MIPLGLVLLTLLCGTTQASVLSTNLSPLNLAAFPVPILSVYSRYAKNGALYAGDEITFDASASTQPVSSTSYVFSFDFGDGGSVLSTSSAVTTHVYASGGYYRAVLRVADTAFASDSSQMYAVDADAYPASPTYVQVYVHERDTCYPYNITSNWTAGTDGTLGITVSLVNSASPASIAASTSLTSAFSSSGPPPLATIYNLTVSYSAFCSKYGSAWNMSVPYSLFNYYSPTIMTVSSNSTSVQGCAPRTTKFDISAQSNLTYFGYPMDTIKSDGTYSGLSIKSSNYQPAYLRLRTHGCMKKTGIAVLGSQSVGDSHGAHVIVSSSAFNTTLFRDLSQDPSGGVTPSQSMCTGITTCSNLQLQDVVILTSGALFATNRGLYMSSAIPMNGVSPSYATFNQLMTGQSAIDNGKYSALTTTVFLSSVPDCVQAGGTYIFVAFAPTGSSIQGSLIYTNESNLNVGAWSSVITAAGISGLSSVYMFVGMTRYPPLLSNVYVLGISSSWCGSTVQACAGSAVVVVHNTTTSSISVLFTFPSTSTVVTGIHLHANGVDMYVYGSELWHSIDGGRNWLQLFSLGNTVNSITEVFTKVDSSFESDSLGLVTNLKHFYYSRGGGHRGVVLVNMFNAASTSLVDVLVDATGTIFAVSIPTVTSYSSITAAYPMGFLNSINGDIRGFQNSYLQRLPIPTDSVARVADYSFAASLVPVFIGRWRVQLYAYSSISGQLFQYYHVGMRISLSSGGSAVIKKVSAAGLVADCVVTDSFLGDSTASATSASLVVGVTTLGDMSSPTVSDSTSVSSTTTFTLSGGSGTWYLSDVGKSVVAGYGSFLITAITSPTTAVAIVVRAPLTQGIFASGSWQLYNLGPFGEYAITYSQGLTVGSVSAGLATVTLASGSLAFSAALQGKFLVLSDGYGIIQDVKSSTTLTATWFAVPGSATYSAGSWSVFDGNDKFTPGTFPTQPYRTRAWNLTLNDCPWSTISKNITASAQYLSFQETMALTAKIGAKTFNDNPYFQMVHVSPVINNAGLYNQSVSVSDNEFGRSSAVSVVLIDTGVVGRSGVSWRPSCNSLLCPALDLNSVQLIDGCSPSRQLLLKSSISDYDFLYGQPVILDNFPVMQTLPVNYRPPSSLGNSIPTSNNLYNADPSQPRYNNRYPISQRTGIYKQCLGKVNRAACGCTDEERLSMQVRVSDCMDRVPRVLNDQTFLPVYLIRDQDIADTLLTKKYTLTELNNRTDYCLRTTSKGTICGSANLYTTLLDPSTNDSIGWLSSSSELFHFHVQIAEQEFCASLSLEFAVYVVLPTPRTAVILTYMSIAAVAFALFLLLVYVYNWNRQKAVSM